MKNQHISINKLWSKLKARFTEFDVIVEHLDVVVQNNNITRNSNGASKNISIIYNPYLLLLFHVVKNIYNLYQLLVSFLLLHHQV